jgi:uracil-DNA glycosylase
MSQESVGSRNQNWAQLRADVKNCRFTCCPRYTKKLPVFFCRQEDTISKIRFIFLSQEVPAKFRGECNENAEKIEDLLIRQCKEMTGVVPPRLGKILGKGFDPTVGKVYWTHSLKCVRNPDQDIRKEWKDAAPLCERHFKREIQLIPSQRLILIPLGNYALALCRHLLEDTPLPNPKGIVRYIKDHASPDFQEKGFLGKKVLLLPFIHPSHSEQHLKRQPRLREIEKSFVKKIGEWDCI